MRPHRLRGTFSITVARYHGGDKRSRDPNVACTGFVSYRVQDIAAGIMPFGAATAVIVRCDVCGVIDPDDFDVDLSDDCD